MRGPRSDSPRRSPRPRPRRSSFPAILFGAAFCLRSRRSPRWRSASLIALATLIGPLAGGLRRVPADLRRRSPAASAGTASAAEARPVSRRTPEIAAARIEAERARARLMDTAQRAAGAAQPARPCSRRLAGRQGQGRRPRRRCGRRRPQAAGRRDRRGRRNRLVPRPRAADGPRRQARRRRQAKRKTQRSRKPQAQAEPECHGESAMTDQNTSRPGRQPAPLDAPPARDRGL